jgi:hypothetical protein
VVAAASGLETVVLALDDDEVEEELLEVPGFDCAFVESALDFIGVGFVGAACA